MTILAKVIRTKSADAATGYRSRHILRALNFHGMTELFYKQFPHKPKLHNALNVLAKQSSAVEMIRANEFEKVLRVLHRKNVDFLVFKGTALAYFHYKHPWQRPRSDTDLLIHYDDLSRIQRSLEKLGYTKQSGISGKLISYQCTFTKTINEHFVHRLDVHWRINNRQTLAHCYSLEELLENSLSCTVRERDMFIPGPIDAILLAVIHRIGHHADKERLIWLYDIHLLCSALNQEQWLLLIAKARKKRISAITFEAISSAYNLFDTKIDRKHYHILKKKPDTDEASAIFLQRHLSEWTLFWHDIKALPSWLDKLRLIKENVIPDRTYMATAMQEHNIVIALIKRTMRGSKRILKRN